MAHNIGRYVSFTEKALIMLFFVIKNNKSNTIVCCLNVLMNERNVCETKVYKVYGKVYQNHVDESYAVELVVGRHPEFPGTSKKPVWPILEGNCGQLCKNSSKQTTIK